MSVTNNNQFSAYGIGAPSEQLPPEPIISMRAPTASDFAQPGTIWVNQSTNIAYTLINTSGGMAIWGNQAVVGTNLANLTVNPGPVTLTADTTIHGDLIQDTGDVTITGTSFDLNTAGGLTLQSGEAAADAVQIIANDAAGGIDMLAGTGGVSVAITNGTFAVTTGTQPINLGTDGFQKTITIGNGTGNTSLVLNAGTGAVNIGTNAVAHTVTIGNATGATSVVLNAGTGAVNIGSNAVAHATTVGSTTGAAATTVQAGTGGLALSAAGLVSVAPSVDTQASPSAASTVNERVGRVTFTGFTTASAGTQAFTITNNKVIANSGILVTVQNLSAGNDGQMTLTSVVSAVGSFVVNTTNNGTQALDGNVIITFWVIS